MIEVTGAGPWPGLDPREAQTVVCGDAVAGPSGVDGMPWLVRLPDRGALDSPTAQGLGLLVDLPAELGPHGWRFADRPGRDAARLAARRRESLDALAVAAHGWAGPLVVPVSGPYTLAASVYLARGDRAVADPGAVTELVASLGAGLADHLAALRRAVPGAEPVAVVQEPLLAAVLAGTLPSFSGYTRLRGLPVGVVTEGLIGLIRLLHDQGADRVVVQVGTAAHLLPLVVATGADGAGTQVAGLDDHGWEHVAGAVESGLRLWAGIAAPPASQCAGADPRTTAAPLLDGWRRVGLPARGLAEVTLVAPAGPASDTPGRAGDGDRARAVLADTLRAAALVGERAEDG